MTILGDIECRFGQNNNMNERRINVYVDEKLIDAPLLIVTEFNDLYFIAYLWINKFYYKYCNDGIIRDHKTDFVHQRYSWKPHEYRHETRQSCLFAYWFLKRRLGKDPAGIVAKFVWSTRFDFCWEKLFTLKK